MTGAFKDGPYASTTPDSGTCGNNWAVDLFNRQFVVSPQNSDGSWTVVEKFANAKFITLGDGETGSGASPGQCEAGNSTHLLREGVSGTISGSFTILVNPGYTFTSNKGCGPLADWPTGAGNGSTPGDCTTGQWIANAFPGATYLNTANVTTFTLTYKANSQTWVNSSSGNTGDIFTAVS